MESIAARAVATLFVLDIERICILAQWRNSDADHR